MEALGPARRGHLHPGRPPRPPRRGARAIALAGAGLERFATEMRNLQRTEVREVEEPFATGPEGLFGDAPQAQPDHSPSGSCGLARVLRGYAQAGLENVALWHERDISHSGAERVILPDATILLDYMQHLAHAARRRDDRPRGADAGEPRAHPRRAVQPAGADRAGRVRDGARRRPTGSSRRRHRRRGTSRRASGSCWRERGTGPGPGRDLRPGRVPRAPARRCSNGSRRFARANGRSTRTAGVPPRGDRVTLRRTIFSGRSLAGRRVARRRIVDSTTRISSSANAAPMQRRVPPPNGIQP